MKINSQFIDSKRPNVVNLMDHALSHILETYVEPNINQSDNEEKFRIAKLSIILQEIAEKAEAYYKLQEQGYEKTPYSLN